MQPATLDKYRTLFDSAIDPKNAELKHWFGGLQACNHFQQMSLRELLAFAQELANSIDMQCVRAKRDDLQAWGPRMLHLTKIIEDKMARSSLPVRDELEALVARAYAFGGNFEKPKEYLLQRVEQEGKYKIDVQHDFDESRFHQVHTSTVLSVLKHHNWKASMEYLFVFSLDRWRQCKIGIVKFLVNKKLDTVVRWAAHPDTFKCFLDWSKTAFYTVNMHKFEDMLNFLLATLNGNEYYRTAKDFIIKVHAIGKSCSGDLVVETIRGLLTEGNGTLDSSVLKKMTATPEEPSNILPEIGTTKRPLPPPTLQASPDSDSQDLYSSRVHRPLAFTRGNRRLCRFGPADSDSSNEPFRKRPRLDM